MRIGIDVGGTFTHSVALDDSLKPVAYSKVPTTHRAENGIAEGVIASLEQLLQKIRGSQVTFIAYSTTQATNAVLEGDLERVGLIVIGSKMLRRSISTRFEDRIAEVSPDSSVPVEYAFLDKRLLVAGGPLPDNVPPDSFFTAEYPLDTIVVSQEIATEEDFTLEEILTKAIREDYEDLRVIAAAAISKMPGFQRRTKTALVNAAMIKKMKATVGYVNDALERLGISSPLYVISSTGGIMSIEETEREPLLTILSGPAASVSAAIHFSRVSDCIYFDVGGTSTDISVIKGTRLQFAPARVGETVFSISSIDSRTVALGGGSLLRIKDGSISVGPRSAHIAGLAYASLWEEPAAPSVLEQLSPVGIVYSDGDSVHRSPEQRDSEWMVELVSPTPADPEEYVVLRRGDIRLGLTLTCMANYLGLIPEWDPAFRPSSKIAKYIELAATALKIDPEELAQRALEAGFQCAKSIIEGLVRDYELDLKYAYLVGGGGGAYSVLPYISGRVGARYAILPYYDIISSIGAAVSITRIVKEELAEESDKEAVDEMIVALRSDLLNRGVAADAMRISVQYDFAAKRLRAVGEGTLRLEAVERKCEDELRTIAAKHLRTDDTLTEESLNDHLVYYTARSRPAPCLLLDRFGYSKLLLRNHRKIQLTGGLPRLLKAIEDEIRYTDAGPILPEFYLIIGERVLDCTALPGKEAIPSLVEQNDISQTFHIIFKN